MPVTIARRIRVELLEEQGIDDAQLKELGVAEVFTTTRVVRCA